VTRLGLSFAVVRSRSAGTYNYLFIPIIVTLALISRIKRH